MDNLVDISSRLPTLSFDAGKEAVMHRDDPHRGGPPRREPSLAGRSALITGASRGLGRALALELGRQGARLVLVARGRRALVAVAEAIREAGGEAHALPADVGDPEAAVRLAGQAAALVGPVDLLIHAASTLGPTPLPRLLDTDPAAFLRVLQVNLLGPFRLTRAIVGGMAVRGAGTVLAISSDAAVEAYPAWGAYGASKAALDHLTRTWAAELGEAGVRVLSVDPGEMDTDMHAAAIPDADPASLSDPTDVARWVLGWLAKRPASGSRAVAQVAAQGVTP
jgi:NAD(P)-dependent dehydrogenase (short-subunit alcohol dehydrogenase family)